MKNISAIKIFVVLLISIFILASYGESVFSSSDNASNELSGILASARKKLQDNDFDGAIDNFNKALSINKNSPAAYAGLGNAYSRKGDFEKAIEYYNKAISLKAESPGVYTGLGN